MTRPKIITKLSSISFYSIYVSNSNSKGESLVKDLLIALSQNQLLNSKSICLPEVPLKE